jgi:hypothetical protein
MYASSPPLKLSHDVMATYSILLVTTMKTHLKPNVCYLTPHVVAPNNYSSISECVHLPPGLAGVLYFKHLKNAFQNFKIFKNMHFKILKI